VCQKTEGVEELCDPSSATITSDEAGIELTTARQQRSVIDAVSYDGMTIERSGILKNTKGRNPTSGSGPFHFHGRT